MPIVTNKNAKYKKKTPEELAKEKEKQESAKSLNVAANAVNPETPKRIARDIAEMNPNYQAEKQAQTNQEQAEKTKEIAGTPPEAVKIPVGEQKVNIGKNPIDKGIWSAMGQWGGGRALIASGELRGLPPETAKGLPQLTKRMQETGETAEQLTNNPMLQDVLRLQLNDVDFQVLASGEAKIGAFSQIIESLPIAGRIGRYVSIGPLPESKVKTMLANIDEIETQASADVSFAKQNPALIDTYLKQIQEAESKVLELESKIKLVSIQSPSLQSDPEEVDRIMSKITTAKQSIYFSKTELQLLKQIPQNI